MALSMNPIADGYLVKIINADLKAITSAESVDIGRCPPEASLSNFMGSLDPLLLSHSR
jgi:hypothetical protein